MIHKYLKSVGFSQIQKNENLYELLDAIIYHPDERMIERDSCGNDFACFSKYIQDDMGVSVCGCFMQGGKFRMEYYYPFFFGSTVTTAEPVEVERNSLNETFFGICDELKMGIPLIFSVNNVMDVLRENRRGDGEIIASHTVLSGLAYSGKILLPVMKTREHAQMKEKSSKKRMNLMIQAREGDKSALENLTLNDMDTYAAISRRVIKEDILSIVESSIIPYGVETDQYTVIGEILNCYKVKNHISGDLLWVLSLSCNHLEFDICINSKDLYGEPEIGRRFKGRIWMQGYLNFGC